MATKGKARNPYTFNPAAPEDPTGQISDAYYKIKDIAVDLRSMAGRIGNSVFNSEADRRAGKQPLRLDQKETDVWPEEVSTLITDSGLMAQVMEVMDQWVANRADMTEAVKDGNGYVCAFTNEVEGGEYTDAYWKPILVEVNYDKGEVKVTVGVYATKTLAESGSAHFPLCYTLNLGTVVDVMGPAAFIDALDTKGGRGNFYSEVKNQKPNLVDAQ